MDETRTVDHSLIARVARHDRDALEALYHRHAPWLLRRLEARCADPDLVDIALQDTFLAVWRTAGRYRGDGDVGAWLWGIAIRRLIDQLRKRRPEPVAPERLVGGTLEVEEAVLGTGAHGPLAGALRALPPELSAVLVATAIDGLTTKEAARLLGIPQGTVKTRLQRARRQLQEALA